MSKVFILERGEYSDREIESVWSTKEKAEAYLEQRGYSYREDWGSWTNGEFTKEIAIHEVDIDVGEQ